MNATSTLTPVKRALLEIRDLRARLQEAEAARREPIAIVGMSLRFPGATDPESFWRLLIEGRDAIREIPRDRWDADAFYDPDPDRPGAMNVRRGAFLDGVDRFDAGFFGISGREAETMDPQHRILLEVAWEALEHAAISPADLAGSRAGVFLGINHSDYLQMLLADTKRIDAYASSGNAGSMAAGRLSYLLGIHGPSVALDTACSSSLVAVHLACQSLRLGESSLALAGGVNLILSPELSINFSKARMLAPDGRCKTFDRAADGYVRGEGCAMIVLKRLSAAQADGNRILAVIRGSAVNQDGRSAGITAPNGPAQEAVLRQALSAAEVTAPEMAYVETHGTGTPLGDPIEVQALARVYGEGRAPRSPLWIGSLKTNIGHLEAAAGIAGLIKVVLALQHGEIPPHLNLSDPNPHIDWKSLPVAVPIEATGWPASAMRIAGVSSFGISGTNAHVILAAPPASQPAEPVCDRPLHILALSARDGSALRELAGRYGQRLAAEDAPIADACFSANAGRSHFQHRVAAVGATAAEIRERLAACSPAAPAPGSRPRIAFLFTGQGSQFSGMAAQLYDTSPVFRKTLDRCAVLLEPHMDRPLLSVLRGAGAEAALRDTTFAQPALFAVEYALAELWQSWGITPAVVSGHSAGEYVAACLARVFSLEDALNMISIRAKLMGSLPRGGAMAAVFAPESQVRELLFRCGRGVSIAAINGPNHIVVSGDEAEVDRIRAGCAGAGVRSQRLAVSHAFHSPLVDPILDELEAAAGEIRFSPPQIAYVSNLSGDFAGGETVCTARYWRRHARETVLFAGGLETMFRSGVKLLLEIGPKPVLAGMGIQCLPADAKWFASLREGSSDWHVMLESLRGLYLEGCAVDWAGFDRDYPRRRIELPVYPFQRRRYWAVDRQATPKSSQPAWNALQTAARRESERAPVDVAVGSYSEKWACLDRLTAAQAFDVLRRLGALEKPGEPGPADSILRKCGISPIYRRLVDRWLKLIAAHGTANVPAAGSDLATRRAEVERVLADDPFLLAYVLHCSDKLERVITGAESALETLFPNGDPALAQNLYSRANAARYANALVAAAVEAAVRSFPGDRRVRLLEIGAGTGAVTAALLPHLPPERTEYLFTDISEYFFASASARFAAYPFLRFQRLDIEAPQHGCAPGSFEIAIAANALHAVRNLETAIRQARRLLAPGGILVLLEATRHLGWFDMTTGLIEGWQHFEDKYRVDTPLLSPERWRAALIEQGFDEIAIFPETGCPAEVFAQHVIAARAPQNSEEAERSADAADRASLRSVAAAAGAAEAGVELLRKLRRADGDRQRDAMLQFVNERLSRVLRIEPDRPPAPRDRLMDLGMDSLMAVQFRNQLQSELRLGEALPSTLVFDYPTPEAIAGLLIERLFDRGGPRRETRLRPAEQLVETLTDEDVEALLLERLKNDEPAFPN